MAVRDKSTLLQGKTDAVTPQWSLGGPVIHCNKTWWLTAWRPEPEPEFEDMAPLIDSVLGTDNEGVMVRSGLRLIALSLRHVYDEGAVEAFILTPMSSDVFRWCLKTIMINELTLRQHHELMKNED